MCVSSLALLYEQLTVSFRPTECESLWCEEYVLRMGSHDGASGHKGARPDKTHTTVEPSEKRKEVLAVQSGLWKTVAVASRMKLTPVASGGADERELGQAFLPNVMW